MKSIILHSGGMDSTILASKLKGEQEEMTSLYFDFGHNASSKELEAVQATSGVLDINSDVVDMSNIRNSFVSSDLSVFTVEPNPGKHVLELGSYLLLGPALTYAHKYGFERIFIGYTKLDADYSKEYMKEFLDAFSGLTEVAGYKRIQIDAPFISTDKEQVLRSANNLRDLLELTWSCIHNKEYHCGTCQACISRKKAFKDVSQEDPTKYLK